MSLFSNIFWVRYVNQKKKKKNNLCFYGKTLEMGAYFQKIP